MRRRLRLLAVGVALTLLGVLLAAAVGGTVGSRPPTEAATGSEAAPGIEWADLDGDHTLEQVTLARGRGGITIRDGDLEYRSRPKWWVATAALADADRNGLPEAVALLDADDGRHLGLIGWHTGGYHERLVSSVLPLHPLALEVRDDPSLGGWVVVLTETPSTVAIRPDHDTPPPTTTYRWNGFGFIAVAGEGAAR